MIIHTGDCSNHKDPYKNEPEVRKFIEWFKNLHVKYKIFIPGNHETSIEKGLVTRKDFEDVGIIYLENEYITIENIKIFGSPYQPTFGTGWAFNKDRSKLDAIWKEIDDDVDIVAVHGPPKTILDKAYDRTSGHLMSFGCSSLKRHVLTRIKPKLCLFGHMHNNDDILNAGVLKLSGYDTRFSNGSVSTDGKWGKLTSNGNILTI